MLIKETIHHLFFDCVIARRAWELVSEALGVQTGKDFESVAKLWICNKKVFHCEHCYFSCLLEYLETKNSDLLPGCCLTRNAYDRELNLADVEMLESVDPSENGGWLPQCNLFAGASSLETGADQTEPAL
jgi:hypothetical protein